MSTYEQGLLTNHIFGVCLNKQELGSDPVVIYARDCSTTRTIEKKNNSALRCIWFIQCVLLRTKEKLPILQSRISINYSYKEIKPGLSPDSKKNSHRLVVCPKTLWSLGTETTKASVTRFICCFPKFSKFNLCSPWIHFLCAPPQ